MSMNNSVQYPNSIGGNDEDLQILSQQIESLYEYKTLIRNNNNVFTPQLTMEGYSLNILQNIACVSSKESWNKFSLEQVTFQKQATFDVALEGIVSKLKEKIVALRNSLFKRTEKTVVKSSGENEKASDTIGKLSAGLKDVESNREIKDGPDVKSIVGYTLAAVALIAVGVLVFRNFGSLISGSSQLKTTILTKLKSIKWPGKNPAVQMDGSKVSFVERSVDVARKGYDTTINAVRSAFKHMGEAFTKLGSLISDVRSKLSSMFEFKFLQNTLGKGLGNEHAAKQIGRTVAATAAAKGINKTVDAADNGTFGQRIQDFIQTCTILRVVLRGAASILSMMSQIFMFSAIGSMVRGSGINTALKQKNRVLQQA